MYNAVGGSTIHWSAHFPRFHPSDFRTKTLDGVADDWPLTYDDLEPYFDTNDRIMGVAGMTGDTAYPPKSERQTPPLPLGHPGRVMARGFDKLGWHWWPSDATILTAPYDGRAAATTADRATSAALAAPRLPPTSHTGPRRWRSARRSRPTAESGRSP